MGAEREASCQCGFRAVVCWGMQRGRRPHKCGVLSEDWPSVCCQCWVCAGPAWEEHLFQLEITPANCFVVCGLETQGVFAECLLNRSYIAHLQDTMVDCELAYNL